MIQHADAFLIQHAEWDGLEGLSEPCMIQHDAGRPVTLLDSEAFMVVAIVQISDLHISVSSGAQILQTVPPLTAAVCAIDPTCSEFFLVITGDVAWSGQQAEYELAERFITDVKQAIKRRQPRARVRVIAVPGNHDCHLPEVELALRKALVSAIQPTLQTIQPDASIVETLLDRQNAFFQFTRSLDFSGTTTLDKLCSRHLADMDGFRLQFNLYNTALLSRRDEQQGELSIPLEVVRSTAIDSRAIG